MSTISVSSRPAIRSCGGDQVLHPLGDHLVALDGRVLVAECRRQVRDATGTTDTESFQITIDPPRPLTISNQSDVLSEGTVGEFYCCGNLFADGGVPDYTWALVDGELPPGLSLSESPGRITGTPTTAGTFSFTVRVTDDRGATAERTFSITIT